MQRAGRALRHSLAQRPTLPALQGVSQDRELAALRRSKGHLSKQQCNQKDRESRRQRAADQPLPKQQSDRKDRRLGTID